MKIASIARVYAGAFLLSRFSVPLLPEPLIEELLTSALQRPVRQDMITDNIFDARLIVTCRAVTCRM